MKYSVLFFLVFFIAGCASTTLKNQSGVDRKQLLLMPQSMVEGMAKDSYRTALQEASKKINSISILFKSVVSKELAIDLLPMQLILNLKRINGHGK